MSWFDSLTAMFKDHRVDVAKRFEFSREAIHGTMSKFRQAFDHERKETVGLKILDDEKLGNFEARFKGLKKPTEGEIAVQLHHPNIVKTYEFGETTDRQQYIVMEFVEGQGLNALIQDRTEALNGKRVQLIRQMVEAIEAVHNAGFIHRDICPRNFICDVANAKVKLIDFGLTIPDEAPYRLPGNRTGTPLYMAPEIVRRRETDKRVDLFAFGITCYRLLTFELPWQSAETTGKAALQHDTNKPTSILEHFPRLHPRLAEVVMSCLEPNPDNRPPSAEAFLKKIAPLKTEID